jgi:hypothetical protein
MMALRVRSFYIVIWCMLLGAVNSRAQQRLNWSGDDGKRVESLVKGGSRIEGTHVILYFPPSLSHMDAEALLKRLDPAVEGLWRQVGVHDWQAVAKQKIAYYIHDDAFVSHASGRAAVFLPMARVKDGRAPFLHETVHELLATAHRTPAAAGGATSVRYPLWLTEGMADYVARVVADRLGIVEAGPFGTPTLSGVDTVCAERARTPDGAKMLPFVGADAVPDVLFTTDRARFAPTFYSCSLSFTKYLAEHTSLDSLINLFARPPTELVAHIDGVAGRPLPAVVTEWRTKLGLNESR